jgi:hypothetical protein
MPDDRRGGERAHHAKGTTASAQFRRSTRERQPVPSGRFKQPFSSGGASRGSRDSAE